MAFTIKMREIIRFSQIIFFNHLFTLSQLDLASLCQNYNFPKSHQLRYFYVSISSMYYTGLCCSRSPLLHMFSPVTCPIQLNTFINQPNGSRNKGFSVLLCPGATHFLNVLVVTGWVKTQGLEMGWTRTRLWSDLPSSGKAGQIYASLVFAYSIGHMFWSCQVLTKFWLSVFKSLSVGWNSDS